MEQYQFPVTREGLTRKIDCGVDVYLTVNPKGNGEPGEIFVKVAKQGSTVSGLMDALAKTISIALRQRVAWPELREKYLDTKFDPKTHEYTSLVDAVARNIDDMIAELRELRDEKMGQKKLEFK